jgi:putative membrane protein
MLVKDHGKAVDELKSIATKKALGLPAMLEKKAREDVDDLAKKTGLDFDKAYLTTMVDKHEDSVELFEDAAKNCKDADLRTFANKLLPTLKAHHRAGLDLRSKLNELTQR